MDRATVDHLLTTTRTVRRRLDLTRPVEPGVIQECLEIAIQAPNAGNQNRYHFVVVTDPAKRAAIGAIYKKVFYQEHVPLSGAGDPGLPVYQKRSESIQDSASYLAEHLSEVPVHIIPCVESRFENAGTFRQATRYGSILPAAWSLMLALRSRGLGTAWTTLYLYHEKEVAALLGIPDDITQTVLLPVAYYTGTDFRPGKRVPAHARTYWDVWGLNREARSKTRRRTSASSRRRAGRAAAHTQRSAAHVGGRSGSQATTGKYHEDSALERQHAHRILAQWQGNTPVTRARRD